MPRYQVKAPDGRTVVLEGPEPPTDADLDELFASLPAKPDAPSREQGDTADRFLEPAATIASAAAAEPLAGLVGLYTALTQGPGAGANAVREMREKLTFQPKTQEGAKGLEAVGETLKPLADGIGAVETKLGDVGYDLAGPVGGAVGETLPTALMEGLGLSQVRRSARASRRASNADIDKALSEAVPTKDELKGISGDIYKEIDNMGVTVRQDSLENLAGSIASRARSEGMDPVITPKAFHVVEEIKSRAKEPMSLSEVERLRKIARGAAGAPDASEARMGRIIVDEIDDYLDSLSPSQVEIGDAAGAGKKLSQARDLWSRASKARVLEDAVENARNQASGFENGLRTQFRSILKSPRRMRGFNKAERAAMERVVQGGTAENIAKFVGRFGLTEGQATSTLMSFLGMGAGYGVLGPVGAIAVPVVGQSAKKIAQTLTRQNAQLAQDLVKAGKNGRKIAAAYLKNTPKKDRNAGDLAALLIEGEEISELAKNSNRLVADSAALALIFSSGEGVREAALDAGDDSPLGQEDDANSNQ